MLIFIDTRGETKTKTTQSATINGEERGPTRSPQSGWTGLISSSSNTTQPPFFIGSNLFVFGVNVGQERFVKRLFDTISIFIQCQLSFQNLQLFQYPRFCSWIEIRSLEIFLKLKIINKATWICSILYQYFYTL